ncbi:GTP cyclohydrolase II [Rhodobacteraceae bacterium KMM 6894]|nr:GTP cyclohydrolase II [Rhodobacteraceae bacterium KMM 6894]
MSLLPLITDLLARARADLRMGMPVALIDASGTRGVVILAAETATTPRMTALRNAGNTLCLSVTARRAETLKARAYDGDLARIIVPASADLTWVQATIDPEGDLKTPMKGPFTTARGGDSDLHRLALNLCKSARVLPAALVQDHPDAASLAKENNLTALPATAGAAAMATSSPLHPVVSARLPMAASQAGRLHVFRPEDGSEEHYAIEIGRPDRTAPVLARLHSACFTGDVMGSLKCDCGPQLHAALAQMGAQGAGILLYLNQEGRGIGLANKMRAYSLQDQGFDTVEANHRLGFEDDERDFRTGANILKRLGFASVRLLTNNPAKIDMMTRCGITVTERVPLKVGQTEQNRAYLATKAAKSGHML